MVIEAVFFDLGGVILRTEHQAPREHLAERLNLSYEDLARIVFESDSARQASLGQLSTQQHWEVVAARLGRPAAEIDNLRHEFFGGDVLDRELLDFIRSLRPTRRTGLISNGWADLREYVAMNKFDDAFDALVISAEVGLLKPEPQIYELALRKLGAAPGQSVLVDDSLSNVQAANALGMVGILFRNPDQMRLDLTHVLG
ncbi:MAG: HAD family phosphatase [Chloroflexota bacterium]